ncbi:MAG: ATP-binding protein [Candidatus Ratteibacteria bacterium]
MISYQVSLLLTAGINILFAISVYVKNQHRLSNRVFPLSSLNLALWCFSTFAIVSSHSTTQAEIAIRIACSIGAFLPANFRFFVDTLGRPQEPFSLRQKRVLTLFYLLGICLAAITWLPNFIRSVEFSPPGVFVDLPGPEAQYDGPLFFLYSFGTLLLMAEALFRLFQKTHTSHGIFRLEVQYVFIAILSGTIFVAGTSLFPALLGSTLLSRFAPFSSVIMTGIISYAIARYHILDISIVFEMTTLAILVTGVLLLFYLASTLLLTKIQYIFLLSPSYSSIPILFSAFAVALLYTPVKKFIQNLALHRIFPPKIDTGEISKELTATLFSHIEFFGFFNDISRLLSSKLHIPETMGLILPPSTPQEPSIQTLPATWSLEHSSDSSILASFQKEKKALIREELERFPHIESNLKIIQEFKKNGFDLAVPILQRETVFGAILFRNKHSQTLFTRQELLLLENIGLQLGIAIENLALYRRLSRLHLYQDSLLENSPSGVIGIDADNRVIIFNREAERLTGYQRSSMLGKEYNALPEELKEIVFSVRESQQNIRGVERTVLNREKNIPLQVLMHTSAFYDSHKKFLGIQLIFSDITPMKNLKENIARTERLASIGILAAGLAHEIKNPLVSIRTFAQLLPQKFEDAEFREVFSKLAIQEVNKINSLVEAILAFAKQKPPEFREVSLGDIIRDTLLLIGIQKNNIQVSFTELDGKKTALLDADAEKLKQVFLNLILNSRDAMPKGGDLSITITEENNHLKTVLSDTGSGIEEALIEKIFDPFFTTREKGTGLGLSIVATIIHEHHGTISITSLPSTGTTVSIELPKHQSEEGQPL